MSPDHTAREDPRSRPFYLQVEHPRPRVKDRHLLAVEQWRGGCLYCGAADVVKSLPGSDGRLTMPLCARHVRWAMASRHERVGKQARHLKKLLLAWCRYSDQDPAAARAWLGY